MKKSLVSCITCTVADSGVSFANVGELAVRFMCLMGCLGFDIRFGGRTLAALGWEALDSLLLERALNVTNMIEERINATEFYVCDSSNAVFGSWQK